MKVKDLINFIKDNNIPKDCYIVIGDSSKTFEYDGQEQGFSHDPRQLVYQPVTDISGNTKNVIIIKF